MAYVRTVKTASGATAVQIVHSTRGGKRDIEHVGPADEVSELATLRTAAAVRLAGGQVEVDLDADLGGKAGTVDRPLPDRGLRCAGPTTRSDRAGHGVPQSRAGPDRRTDLDTGQRAGVGRGRGADRAASELDRAAAQIRDRCLARAACRRVRETCGAGAGLVDPLRSHHTALRDRRR